MSSYYQKLVDEFGEETAKARMREIRAHVKNPGGFSHMSKIRLSNIARKGAEARWHKDKNEETQNSGQPG